MAAIHALRHTFGTHLSKAGVAARVAMAAMRYSSIQLTMKVYTDPVLLDVGAAVEHCLHSGRKRPRLLRIRRELNAHISDALPHDSLVDLAAHGVWIPSVPPNSENVHKEWAVVVTCSLGIPTHTGRTSAESWIISRVLSSLSRNEPTRLTGT